MQDIAHLGIRVDSAGAVLASGRLDRLTASGARAETTTQRMTRAFMSLRTVLATLGLGFVVREIIQVTDQFNLAASRIRLYTDSLEEAAGAQRALLGISNETRSDMFATLELFSRVSQARGELGRSTGEILRFVEQIQKLTIVSGATPQEARNAIIQLSQGLSSGELRGEELRSVIEQLPAVARTIADQLGITVGRFRELAFEGEITANVIVDAILAAADATDERFSQIPVTVGQAWQVMKNNAVTAIAEVNNAMQGNQSIASGLMSAASGIGSAIRNTYLIAASGFDRVREVFGQWTELYDRLNTATDDWADNVTYSFTRVMHHLGTTAVDAFTNFPTNIRTSFEVVIGIADRFRIRAVAVIHTLALAMLDKWQDVRHGAEGMWLKLKMLFAEGVDGLIGIIRRIASGMGAVAGVLGNQQIAGIYARAAGALREYGNNAESVAGQIRNLNAARALEEAQLLDQIALIQADARVRIAASEGATAAALAERDAIIERIRARLEEQRVLREGLLSGGAPATPLAPGGGSATLNTGTGEVADDTRTTLDRMSEFAVQAARNMQTAFADFFFDPFDKGLKGLLSSFLNVIRRMVAEIAAQAVLRAIFSPFEGQDGIMGTFANAVLSGGRAAGGPVQAGKAYQVAEFHRPEVFIPETNGRIMQAGQGGGNTINVSITVPPDVDPSRAREFATLFVAQVRPMLLGDVEHRLQHGEYP